jgi:hypothetical protein
MVAWGYVSSAAQGYPATNVCTSTEKIEALHDRMHMRQMEIQQRPPGSGTKQAEVDRDDMRKKAKEVA